MAMFNVKAEVEKVMGRELSAPELSKFRELREVGYANPIDIAREIKKEVWGN